jgi:hypothetical protein
MVRETRDGRYIDGDPKWIQLSEVEMEPYLENLDAREIQDYCRVRQYQIDVGEDPSKRRANEFVAVYLARIRGWQRFSLPSASSTPLPIPQPPSWSAWAPVAQEGTRMRFGESKDMQHLDNVGARQDAQGCAEHAAMSAANEKAVKQVQDSPSTDPPAAAARTCREQLPGGLMNSRDMAWAHRSAASVWQPPLRQRSTIQAESRARPLPKYPLRYPVVFRSRSLTDP